MSAGVESVSHNLREDRLFDGPGIRIPQILEAIKLDGKNARMYANRGAIKLRQRKTEDARKDFAHALQLDPSLKPKIEPLMNLEAAPQTK